MTPNPNISLKGKVAFISGASKGIGVSIAELFAVAGCDLALTARNEQELEQTANNARKAGVKVWTQTAEMADAGTKLQVEILGEMYDAQVLGIPIYDSNGANMRA